jgi:hypothetical protein
LIKDIIEKFAVKWKMEEDETINIEKAIHILPPRLTLENMTYIEGMEME